MRGGEIGFEIFSFAGIAGAGPSATMLPSVSKTKRKIVTKAFEQYTSSVANRLNVIPSIHSISLNDIVQTVDIFIKETGTTPVVIIDYLKLSTSTA